MVSFDVPSDEALRVGEVRHAVGAHALGEGDQSVLRRRRRGAQVVEEATLATPGEPPPPQPAASSENAATATTEVRMSGRRQRTMFGSFQSRARKLTTAT